MRLFQHRKQLQTVCIKKSHAVGLATVAVTISASVVASVCIVEVKECKGLAAEKRVMHVKALLFRPETLHSKKVMKVAVCLQRRVIVSLYISWRLYFKKLTSQLL